MLAFGRGSRTLGEVLVKMVTSSSVKAPNSAWKAIFQVICQVSLVSLQRQDLGSFGAKKGLVCFMDVRSEVDALNAIKSYAFGRTLRMADTNRENLPHHYEAGHDQVSFDKPSQAGVGCRLINIHVWCSMHLTLVGTFGRQTFLAILL